jgi:hypothetical protein
LFDVQQVVKGFRTMATVPNKPASETAGDLPKTAADPGYVGVYDNDTTDGRPASALDAPSSAPYVHEPVAAGSSNWIAWTIGLVILAVVLYFVFQVLF